MWFDLNWKIYKDQYLSIWLLFTQIWLTDDASPPFLHVKGIMHAIKIMHLEKNGQVDPTKSNAWKFEEHQMDFPSWHRALRDHPWNVQGIAGPSLECPQHYWDVPGGFLQHFVLAGFQSVGCNEHFIQKNMYSCY